MAAENGHPQVVRYLIEQGANINVIHTNYWTPLLMAAMKLRI